MTFRTRISHNHPSFYPPFHLPSHPTQQPHPSAGTGKRDTIGGIARELVGLWSKLEITFPKAPS